MQESDGWRDVTGAKRGPAGADGQQEKSPAAMKKSPAAREKWPALPLYVCSVCFILD